MRRPLAAIFLVAAVCVTPAFSEGLPELGDAAQTEISPQAEKRLGDSIMREIRSKEPSYFEDAEITGYLNHLGHRLTAKLTVPHPEFKFFVLRDPTINAFALPGGYIGVHSGLILAAQSESELAGVLAHEISHVTQHHIARGQSQQGQSYATMLAAIALAILAGRNNPDVAMGAIAAGQAGAIQQQLSYSRDYEREADRIGLQLLQSAGFDPRAMATFFQRLQRANRASEGNAPAYLQTHPLTTERIADMESRIQNMPAHSVASSLDFLLVRAKLAALQGDPADAVADFSAQVNEQKAQRLIAARYGLARALLRAGKIDAATAQLAELRRMRTQSAMIETLAADLALQHDDLAAAEKILTAAAAQYPLALAVRYQLVEARLSLGKNQEALQVCQDALRNATNDYRLYALEAKTYARMGKDLLQHRAQGESYALQDQLALAVEQFELAQKASDGDFYERSEVEARLRDLRRQFIEENSRANKSPTQ